MIRTMLLWIAVPLLMSPLAVAVDDPALQDLTVEELWTKWNKGNYAAYERLVELGPEARVLAQRILHPEGEAHYKWPQRNEADLIATMRADAVPELITALAHSVDDDDRIHFINQLESLGRMARPAGDVLMTIALEEDGDEREAALKALAAAQTKKDFLIPEAIRMLSKAGSSRAISPMSELDRQARMATTLLQSSPDKDAETALIRAMRRHPSGAVRENALKTLCRIAPTNRMPVLVLIDCLDDMGGSGQFSNIRNSALQQIASYEELPDYVAADLISRLYRESFDDHSLWAATLAEAICHCRPTDAHATELVTHKLRPLLDDGAYVRNTYPLFLQLAVAAVVLKWNPGDEKAVSFLAKVTNELNNRDVEDQSQFRMPDKRAYAARVLGRLGPKAKQWLPMLHEVMDRERNKKLYSELAEAAAWAIAQIDSEDTQCLNVIRDSEEILRDWPEAERVLGNRVVLLVNFDEVLPELRDPQYIVDGRFEDDQWVWNRLLPHRNVVVPVLLEHLKSNRIDVRIATANLLGDWRISPDISIPAIAELLDDRYASVRAVAAESLAKFGPAAVSAIPKLEHATQDEYLTVKLAAQDALSMIRGIALE